MACSVIMVSYHTGAILFASVKSVLVQPDLEELVLVDNGNPPDILARLQQMALGEPRLKIITGQGNIGFSAACNLAVKDARGEYIVLMNPDCLLPPEALPELVEGFGDVKGAMLAGCWLVTPDGHEERGGRSELLTPGTALSELLGLYCLFNLTRFNRQDSPMPSETHEVPAVSSACMCLRKADYIRLFGLDEGFFLYAQDLDLCMRVHHMGGKVICIPRVRVTRMRSASTKVSLRFREWQKAHGLMRYFTKHYQSKYVPGFLALVKAGIMLRCGIRTADGMLRNFIRGSAPERDPASKRLMILASGLAELSENEKLGGRTIMVTGATSQVGLCVLRRLIASGASVIAVSRGDAIPFEHKQLRWVKGDLTDNALNLQHADSLIHCAPLAHLPGLLDRLAAAGVMRILAFGSTSVFAKAMSKNAYEKELVKQWTRAEAAIADRCPAKGVRWTILRPTLIYGVGLDVGVTSLAKFIRRCGFFPIYPPAFGRRQPVHADDLALGALLALDKDTTYDKAYNVSGGEVLAYRDMLERLFNLYRIKIRIIRSTLLPFALDVAGWLLQKKHINSEVALRMNDDLVFFHDDAKKDFGFSPRPFLSGGMRDIEGF